MIELLRPRRPALQPRVVKRKMSNHHVKRVEHRNPPPPDTTISILAA